MAYIRAALLILSLILSQPTLAAEVADEPYLIPTSSQATNNDATQISLSPSKIFWQEMWGVPATNIFYGGMATFHFNPNSRDDNWNNQLIAVTMNGYFAGTLVNSMYERAYAAGIQRTVYSQAITPEINQSIGYRLGLISGYDKHTMAFAEHSPLLPFPQVTYDLSWHHVGIELSWCLVTASAGLLYEF